MIFPHHPLNALIIPNEGKAATRRFEPSEVLPKAARSPAHRGLPVVTHLWEHRQLLCRLRCIQRQSGRDTVALTDGTEQRVEFL